MKETFKQMVEIMGDKEIAVAIATMYKNIVDSLLEKGFSRSEAIELSGKFGNQK